MGISYYLIIIFGLPLTYAYATLWQSVAGNSTFRGIVFCNLGTSKRVLLKFVTTVNIDTPYLSPCNSDHPNNVPVGQKSVEQKKSLSQICINSLVSHKLSHDRWLWFFFLGAYGSLPDAAIWWCLRTGGGGVLTRSVTCTHTHSQPYYE